MLISGAKAKEFHLGQELHDFDTHLGPMTGEPISTCVNVLQSAHGKTRPVKSRKLKNSNPHGIVTTCNQQDIDG